MEVQVIHQGVVQGSTQIQQLQTHQAHWERTVRVTAEMVAVVEPVVAEPTEARVVQEPQVMPVVLLETLDPI